MIRLRYGNTNTYYINGLLFDTDMPDTLPRFFKALKQNGIPFDNIHYVIASHYHPDHVGLIRELTDRGVRLIVVQHQLPYVHFADGIFRRQYEERFRPIDEARAVIITPEESRAFLKSIGIEGEIIPTGSHSPDGIALILDGGECFAGDLEPRSFLAGYEDNAALENDWNALAAHGAKTVYLGHANDQFL